MRVYHGTTADNLESIKTHGLLCSEKNCGHVLRMLYICGLKDISNVRGLILTTLMHYSAKRMSLQCADYHVQQIAAWSLWSLISTMN